MSEVQVVPEAEANANANALPGNGGGGEGVDVGNVIEGMRERILHALDIFPFISNSMLHIAIGTSTQTTLWKPILQGLIDEELVQVTTIQRRTPLDRASSYTILHLPKNEYTFETQ